MPGPCVLHEMPYGTRSPRQRSCHTIVNQRKTQRTCAPSVAGVLKGAMYESSQLGREMVYEPKLDSACSLPASTAPYLHPDPHIRLTHNCTAPPDTRTGRGDIPCTEPCPAISPSTPRFLPSMPHRKTALGTAPHAPHSGQPQRTLNPPPPKTPRPSPPLPSPSPRRRHSTPTAVRTHSMCSATSAPTVRFLTHTVTLTRPRRVPQSPSH